LRVSIKCFALAVLLTLATPVFGQSTDGYHADLVFPVVVDTDSYTTRLYFSHQNGTPPTIRLTYLPAEGTSATAMECVQFKVPAIGTRRFASLREACPALPAGSQFGMLRARLANPSEFDATETSGFSFSGYARVDSAQGIGFAVESFPAHGFATGDTRVHGLRRSVATASAPAYQSNCFVGRLDVLVPSAFDTGWPADVNYELFSSSGNSLGTGALHLQRGKLVRLLDVFAVANVPPGDYDGVAIQFEATGGGGAGNTGITSFCTVQENTHYSADFRIGKVWKGDSVASVAPALYANDDHMQRITQTEATAQYKVADHVSSSMGFTIPQGSEGNTHVIGVRFPDWIACEVVPRGSLVPGVRADGLEMRLVASNGSTVVAGGNGSKGFGPVYLGNKEDHDAGVNTRYTIDVERDGSIPGEIDYGIRCRSGSGHTTPELFLQHLPDRF
jgi:hypothetical protein